MEEYINWIDRGYTSNATSYGLEREERNMSSYKNAMKNLSSTYDIKNYILIIFL